MEMLEKENELSLSRTGNKGAKTHNALFRLPVSIGSLSPVINNLSPNNSARGDRILGPKQTMLVVDDDKTI